MRHVLYGIGTCLSIISLIAFFCIERSHRSNFSFILYWTMVATLLIFDFRNEYRRRERITREINNTRRTGFLLA